MTVVQQLGEPTGASAEQALRHHDRVRRLAELPDVFGVREFCGVLGISERTFYRLKAHGCLPVRPLKLRTSSAIRFSNQAVRRFVMGSR
jgi:predicted DNA-binding transcriptional regulator AlpA